MIQVILFAGLVLFTALFSILISLAMDGVDRKFGAWYQARIGPPLRQPFLDIKKLMTKQTIVPENAVPWVFKGAPLVSLTSAVTLVIYIWLPYFFSITGRGYFFIHHGDIILVMYLLMMPAIGLVAGGFASGSPYAAVGAQREMVLVMCIEMPLAVLAVFMAWKMSISGHVAHFFSLTAMAENPVLNDTGPLGVLGGILLAATMAFIIPAEAARVPFDQGEAETEIAEGLLAEYSGKYLAFFKLAGSVKSLAVVSLTVILFFPQRFAGMTGLNFIMGGYDFAGAVEVAFFFIKAGTVYFVAVTTVRVAMARLKISQVSRFFVLVLTVLGASGFLLMYLDTLVRTVR